MLDAIGDTTGEERERRIGRVLKRWEVRPPRPTTPERENSPIDVSRYTSGEYAGLFVRGGEVDEEDLDSRAVGVG